MVQKAEDWLESSQKNYYEKEAVLEIDLVDL